MRIVNGKKVQVLTALQAFREGYLLRSDMVACVQWDALNFKSGTIKKMVYVNGVYTGITTLPEKFADMCYRLKILE